MTQGADLSTATVGQLLIPVADLERATAYYRDTLGLQHLFTAPPQMSFFMAGTVRLLVGVREDGATDQRGSAIYFKVADIQATYDTLKGRGALMKDAPHVAHKAPTYTLWLCEFTDPDGNTLLLMSEVPVTS
jgi:predicted enzyme related to lactoylglutathione lyase